MTAEVSVMATDVRYEPEGRELDLAHLPPTDYELVTSLYGKIKRGDWVLTCLVTGGDIEMYVRRSKNGKFFGAHFPGEGHDYHPITRETVEHRRQKDYWARAAEACGLDAATEVPVPGGVLDVAVTGGAVATDIEVQRVAVKPATVARRTRVYGRAGFLPVWFNDWGPRPLWLKGVPALGCTPRPWDVEMPRPRSVGATGLGALRVVRCQVSEFGGRCPETRRQPCGRLHPLVEAGKPGLTIDDVAGMVAAGEIVPLRNWNEHVFLVSKADFIRYQEMTGGLGKWVPATGIMPRKPVGLPHPEPCRNPRHDATLGPTVQVCASEPEIAHQAGPLMDVLRQRLPATSTGREICPRCGTARLAHGRTICQCCTVLTKMGRLETSD
jgi:hypothetical protein